MKLKEFDLIRQYLPEDTEIEIVRTSEKTIPDPDEVWAIDLCSWGNHDGRFNVMCVACGDVLGQDFPKSLRQKMAASYLHKPCPKCGKTFIKRGEIKR